MNDHPADETPEGADASGPIVTVRLLELPVPVFARAQQHGDELMREFALLADRAHPQDGESRPAMSRPVPARLLQLVESLGATYGGFTAEQEARLADAVEHGVDVIDEISYRVPASLAPGAELLSGLLDEADEYCRDGQHLLTLATPPTLVRFRRWFLGEFGRQTAGEAPTPWPRYADATA